MRERGAIRHGDGPLGRRAVRVRPDGARERRARVRARQGAQRALVRPGRVPGSALRAIPANVAPGAPPCGSAVRVRRRSGRVGLPDRARRRARPGLRAVDGRLGGRRAAARLRRHRPARRAGRSRCARRRASASGAASTASSCARSTARRRADARVLARSRPSRPYRARAQAALPPAARARRSGRRRRAGREGRGVVVNWLAPDDNGGGGRELLPVRGRARRPVPEQPTRARPSTRRPTRCASSRRPTRRAASRIPSRGSSRASSAALRRRGQRARPSPRPVLSALAANVPAATPPEPHVQPGRSTTSRATSISITGTRRQPDGGSPIQLQGVHVPGRRVQLGRRPRTRQAGGAARVRDDRSRRRVPDLYLQSGGRRVRLSCNGAANASTRGCSRRARRRRGRDAIGDVGAPGLGDRPVVGHRGLATTCAWRQPQGRRPARGDDRRRLAPAPARLGCSVSAWVARTLEGTSALGGTFTVSYAGAETPPLPHNVGARDEARAREPRDALRRDRREEHERHVRQRVLGRDVRLRGGRPAAHGDDGGPAAQRRRAQRRRDAVDVGRADRAGLARGARLRRLGRPGDARLHGGGALGGRAVRVQGAADQPRRARRALGRDADRRHARAPRPARRPRSAARSRSAWPA